MNSRQFSIGDLIVFRGNDWGSKFINAVTFGGYSHIGIVGDDNLIFESTTASQPPCQILGKKIRGSQAQYSWHKIKYYPGKMWCLPLAKDIDQVTLNKFLIDNVGKPYDYLGAERSGGFFWGKVMRLLHKESLSALFCSEFVAASLDHVGYFNTGNASSWSPNSLVRELKRRDLVKNARRLR